MVVRVSWGGPRECKCKCQCQCRCTSEAKVTSMLSFRRSVSVMLCCASIEAKIACWKASGRTTSVICSDSTKSESCELKSAVARICMLVAIVGRSLKNVYAV